MDKKLLRKSISAKKKAMTAAEIEAASDRLTDMFLACDAYKTASSVYGYLSYNQEVRTDRLLAQALKDGKRVAVPKVYGEKMEFIWIEDLDHFAPGAYSIPEPVADAPIADDHNALVLMPGLAFDPEGHRLGYGGGFYDRYLALQPEHPLVALCYGFQLLDHLETESHDIPVDLVICDKGSK